MSLSTSSDRALSISRTNSTDNLLGELELSDTAAAGAEAEAALDAAEAEDGAGPGPSRPQKNVKHQSAVTRPLLTAPSFDQRPAPILGEDSSPWSSTDTSSRSRKNSVNLLDWPVLQTVGGGSGTINNNTLAIQRLGEVAIRTAPPSQSSVDSSSAMGQGSSRNNRSVPDIELHYRRGNSDERNSAGEVSPRLYARHAPHHSQSSFGPHHHGHHSSGSHSYSHHHSHPAGYHGKQSNPSHHLHGAHPLHPQSSHPTASSRPRVCEHQPVSSSFLKHKFCSKKKMYL